MLKIPLAEQIAHAKSIPIQRIPALIDERYAFFVPQSPHATSRKILVPVGRKLQAAGVQLTFQSTAAGTATTAKTKRIGRTVTFLRFGVAAPRHGFAGFLCPLKLRPGDLAGVIDLRAYSAVKCAYRFGHALHLFELRTV
jgi:hypothetical protein